MNFSFVAALLALGTEAAFRLMNAARPAADYLFNSILPEELRATYTARQGSMTVRSTMAGMVGMDSPYPPTGNITMASAIEKIAKFANRLAMPEEALRELQQIQMQLLASNPTGGTDAASILQRDTLLNFLDKLIIQSHLDAFEHLRGQALTDGALDLTFNQIRLQVSYGVPAANMLAARAGADGYGGATSKFWTDMRAQKKLLKNSVRARIAHSDTIAMIVGNDANKVRIIAEDDATRSTTLGRLVGTTEQLSPDSRDRLTLIAYDAEGEVFDPADPTKTKLVPFLKTGKVIAIGAAPPRGFQIGQGSTQSAQSEVAIGYTHIGPTIEGGGKPGRWADLRTPDNAPWSAEGRGVTNGLPMIEAPEKLSVATTEMV